MVNKAQNLGNVNNAFTFDGVGDLGFCAGGDLRGGVNPLKDRLKSDNCVTRAMQDVMTPVRLASNRHLRNWEAPDALVQEIIPCRVKRIVGKDAPWPHRRYR